MSALTHRLIVDGWFTEEERLWPGQRFSLQVKEILHVEHTGFQVRPRNRASSVRGWFRRDVLTFARCPL